MASVIYSALLGGYERPVEQPNAETLGLDMIMFTDNVDLVDTSIWRPIEVQPRFPGDSVRSARHLKVVGHPELDQYDSTIWVDNRVVLKPAAIDLLEELEGFDLVVPHHSYRQSIEGEYREVIASGYDDPARVRSSLAVSRAVGVSDLAKPLWTGLMLRKRTPEVAECMRLWMDLILVGSRRDQLSILAALECQPIKISVLDIDNAESIFHYWTPLNQLDRSKVIQTWRPARRSAQLRLFDAIRANEIARRALRLLINVGMRPPTI